MSLLMAAVLATASWACPTLPPTSALPLTTTAWPVGGGDVNADGFDDLVIFDPESDGASGEHGTGFMEVYLGNASGYDATPILQIYGPGQGRYLGTAGGILGDLDADGYDDILATWEEGSWIFRGGPTGPTAGSYYDVVPILASQFGNSAALPGDLDQDGYDDVAIGTLTESATEDGVHVYRGGPAGVAESMLLENPGAYSLGEAMVAAGDLNCDGYPDLVASGGHNSSSVVIYAGGPVIGEDWVLLEAPVGISGFGRELAATGDVDGDGCDDVLIGHGAGALLYAGNADLDSIAEMSAMAGEEISLSAMGDPDGDAVQRVALGRPRARVGGLVDAGSVTLGDITRDGQAVEVTIEGREEACELGSRVRGLGDLDGDGVPELAIEHEGGWVLMWGDGGDTPDEDDEDTPAEDEDPELAEEGHSCSSTHLQSGVLASFALLGLTLVTARRRGRPRR